MINPLAPNYPCPYCDSPFGTREEQVAHVATCPQKPKPGRNPKPGKKAPR